MYGRMSVYIYIYICMHTSYTYVHTPSLSSLENRAQLRDLGFILTQLTEQLLHVGVHLLRS